MTKEQLIGLFYPVGSIYLTINNVNPNIIFGFGEWEQIKDRFLLAAGDVYQSGSIGGESEHQLTIDEIAAHSHTPSSPLAETDTNNAMSFMTIRDLTSNSTGRQKVPIYNETTDGPEYYRVMCSNPQADDYGSLQDLGSDLETSKTGGNQPHNNMPPYLTVYMWKRIS